MMSFWNFFRRFPNVDDEADRFGDDNSFLPPYMERPKDGMMTFQLTSIDSMEHI